MDTYDVDINFIFIVVGAGGICEAVSGEADQAGEDSESCEE